MIDQAIEKYAENCEAEFKIALIKHKMTQLEMASLLRTTPQQINRAIKGDSAPNSQKLRKEMRRKLDLK